MEWSKFDLQAMYVPASSRRVGGEWLPPFPVLKKVDLQYEFTFRNNLKSNKDYLSNGNYFLDEALLSN